MLGMFIVWLGLSLVAAVVAGNKGRSAIGFFFLSLLASPLVGLIAALVVEPRSDNVEAERVREGSHKKCPFCAELIRAEATVCRFCGRSLSEPDALAPRTSAGETIVTAEGLDRFLANLPDVKQRQ